MWNNRNDYYEALYFIFVFSGTGISECIDIRHDISSLPSSFYVLWYSLVFALYLIKKRAIICHRCNSHSVRLVLDWTVCRR